MQSFPGGASLPNCSWAGCASGGHDPFLGCEEPLALLRGFGGAHSPPVSPQGPCISPACSPGWGGLGLHTPFLLGQDLNLVPRGNSHAQQPNSCSTQLWGDRPHPHPLFAMRISRPRTKAGPTGSPRDRAGGRAVVGRVPPSLGLTRGCGGSGTAGETAGEVARMLRGCCGADHSQPPSPRLAPPPREEAPWP